MVALDLVVLCTLKVVVGAWLRHRGFTHISDDDYARVVIAEAFAGTPKLDPSGTSWLPFPFWLTGSAMLAFGRSLAAARAFAFVLGVVSLIPLYLAARAIGVQRVAALFGVAFAMLTPWSAWLGIATVPEALTASLMVTGALLLARPDLSVAASLALLAASLSRYEAWPVCALAAVVMLTRAAYRSPNPPPSPSAARIAQPGAKLLPSGREDEARTRPWRSRQLVAAAIALAGPALWMAWNARAHGSAMHFLWRVARYRHIVGQANFDVAQRWMAYPRALVFGAPEVAVLFALALLELIVLAMRDRTSLSELGQRWRLPLAAALAQLAFLIYGNLRDGAPTHHPERALLGVWYLLAVFACDALYQLVLNVRSSAGARVSIGAAILGVGVLAWLSFVAPVLRDFPGQTENENRSNQVHRGLELRSAHVDRFTLTPCAYEHFALIAAYGAPERVTIEPPMAHSASVECPKIVVP